MKTKLVIATLLAGSSMFAATNFSIGIGVGNGYAAPSSAYRAPRRGPGYVWVDGYWDRVGARRLWRNGYWTRQSFGRPFVAPQHNDRDRYDQGRNDRDRNDRDRNDGDRDRDNGRGNDRFDNRNDRR